MVVNMNMRGTTQGNINQYLADTIASVFSDVYTVDVIGSTNRELFASNSSDMLDRFSRNPETEQAKDLLSMMNKVKDGVIRYEAGDYMMTDDKAPVELLGMKMIDELIMDEVKYYRRLYEEGGMQALLKML